MGSGCTVVRVRSLVGEDVVVLGVAGRVHRKKFQKYTDGGCRVSDLNLLQV